MEWLKELERKSYQVHFLYTPTFEMILQVLEYKNILYQYTVLK